MIIHLQLIFISLQPFPNIWIGFGHIHMQMLISLDPISEVSFDQGWQWWNITELELVDKNEKVSKYLLLNKGKHW